jgi:hypothetical protein
MSERNIRFRGSVSGGAVEWTTYLSPAVFSKNALAYCSFRQEAEREAFERGPRQ